VTSGPVVAGEKARELALREGTLRGRTEVGAYRFATRVTSLLPNWLAGFSADLAARAALRLAPGRRAMSARHMRRVLGPVASEEEVQASVRQVFRCYARYWVETLRLPSVSGKQLDQMFSIEGLSFFEEAQALGKGVICALPHVGCWEVAGVWLIRQDFPLTAVAERLEPPEVFQWFKELREEKFGLTILTDDDPLVARTLIQKLRQGESLALLADRDLSGGGPEVDFFGERTTLPAGPARLAIQTGAVLLPIGIFEKGDWQYEAVVRPPIPMPSEGTKKERARVATQALATEFEQLIRRAPHQWHLLQPNWPSDRLNETK